GPGRATAWHPAPIDGPRAAGSAPAPFAHLRRGSYRRATTGFSSLLLRFFPHDLIALRCRCHTEASNFLQNGRGLAWLALIHLPDLPPDFIPEQQELDALGSAALHCFACRSRATSSRWIS